MVPHASSLRTTTGLKAQPDSMLSIVRPEGGFSLIVLSGSVLIWLVFSNELAHIVLSIALRLTKIVNIGTRKILSKMAQTGIDKTCPSDLTKARPTIRIPMKYSKSRGMPCRHQEGPWQCLRVETTKVAHGCGLFSALIARKRTGGWCVRQRESKDRTEQGRHA